MSKRGSVRIVRDYLTFMETDPGDSRESVSFSVMYLMVKHDISMHALADRIHVSRDYMPRKINEGRWKLEELDAMSDIFNVHPGDFLHGPKYIKNLEGDLEDDHEDDL
ncbi:helix-turn-helix transcriptional regulator [Streptomyces sp. NPDC000927]|uniref:helix-turn-helix domain-containing protein n=1 Tax=Streptomyces sp. NPDC000927 TaxID=3154371 RepID=UPI00332B5996